MKKIINIIFCVLFIFILVLPILFINKKTEQVSAIDNTILTEWPEGDFSLNNSDSYSTYFEQRVGFRKEAIALYTWVDAALFKLIPGDLHMYGKDGHIFFAQEPYIRSYQRLTTDDEHLNNTVTYLSNTQKYLEQSGISFLYFVCPDKKSVYGEYFPSSIYVNKKNETVLQSLSEKLDAAGVNYRIPLKELLEAKRIKKVYNKEYDTSHWNDLGAFIGHSMIDEWIQTQFTDIKHLDEDDYNLTYEHEDMLDIVKLPIDEDVPVYTLKKDTSTGIEYDMKGEILIRNNSPCTHYISGSVENDKVLLVFHDSYFKGHEKYYDNRFKEVYFIKHQNYEAIQYYVNLLHPDAVVFEMAERTISDALYAYTSLGTLTYETPYTGAGELVPTTSLSINITACSGATLNGEQLLIGADDGLSLVSLEGNLRLLDGTDASKYDCYVRYNGITIEASYGPTFPDITPPSDGYLYVAFQKRLMMPGTMEWIAVDKETGIEYLVKSLEVEHE